MKTVEQIKHLIEDNRHRLKYYHEEMTKSERNRMIRRNEIMLDLQRYLETNPKKEVIERETHRLKKIITAKKNQYHYWRTCVITEIMSPAMQSRLYCKESGLTMLRKQLKNLNFILNENQEQSTLR